MYATIVRDAMKTLLLTKQTLCALHLRAYTATPPEQSTGMFTEFDPGMVVKVF